MAVDPKTALLKAERAVLERKKDEQAVKAAEENIEDIDDFSYTGSSRSSASGQKTNQIFSGKAKKLSPLIVFLILIVGFIAISMTSNSLLPWHFNANTIEEFDTIYPAVEVALETEAVVALKNGSLPSQLAEALTKNGLEVGYMDGDGTFIAGLRPNLDTAIALASAEDSTELADNSLVIRYKGTILAAADVKQYLNDDIEFYSEFRDSVMGHASIHFTDSANQFYATYISSTRDPFSNYVATGDNAEDTEAFHEAYSKIFASSQDSSVNTVVDISYNFQNRMTANEYTKNIETYSGCAGGSQSYACNGDENWNMVYGCYQGLDRYNDTSIAEPCYEYICNDEGFCTWVRNYDYELIDSDSLAMQKYSALHGNIPVMQGVDENGDVTYYANILSGTGATAASGSSSYIQDAIDMSYSIYNTTDAEYKTAALISQAVSNAEIMLSTETYLAYESCINKTMAGEGSECPINQMMNELTTSYDTVDASGNSVSGAAVQESGLASVLTGLYDSNLSTETQSSSVDRVIDQATTAFLEITGTEIASTDGVTSASSVASALRDESMNNTKTTSGSYIVDFGCYFVGKIQDIVSKSTGGIIATITPTISQSVLFGGADEVVGETLGSMLAIGGSNLGNKLASFIAGGTTSTEEGVVAYQETVEYVLARDAAADRLTLSPFDITSKNTFLGSIANQFSSMLISSSGTLDLFFSIRSVISSSFAGIFPGAYASGSDDSFRTTFASTDDCAAGSSYGAASNIYCVADIAFDMDTIKTALDSDDFEDYLESNMVSSTDETTGESKYVPATSSDLQLFLAYNNGRQSNFGSKNNNIYNALTSSDNEDLDKIQEAAGSSGGFWSKLWQSVKNFFSNIVNSLTNLFANSQKSDGKTNVSNELSVQSKITEAKTERIERISTGEEFELGGDYWESSYKYAQAYSIYNLAAEIMGLYSEENTNTASLSKYFQSGGGSNPATDYTFAQLDIDENETDAEYLSRISGLTVDEAEYALNYTTVITYLANFDYDSVYTFEDPKIDADTKIALSSRDAAISSAQQISEPKTTKTQKTRKVTTYVA